jgi:hypothetical protein
MAPSRPYASWTTERKYAEAVRLVLEEAWPKQKAAERLGISRQRLIAAVKKREAELADQAARSEVARQERVTVEAGEPKPLTVTNEVRRVPPVGEFIRTYFDGLECPDCNKHHEVPGFHDEMLDKIVDPAVKRLLINVAPFHAKSTVGTVFSTLYEICKDPNSRTAIVSKSARLAERFLRQIQQFLINPDLYEKSSRNLIDDWGPFVDSKGALGRQSEFYVSGRMSAEKDPTVAAYGIDTQIYGTRFDRIINDDIADLENQKNPDRVAEMLLRITQEHQSRVGKNGKLIVVGTRVSPGDIYSYLENLPGYETFRYPCILDEDSGQTLWGDHFGIEAAKDMRDSMSSEQFELVYQQSPLAGIGASFTPEQLERCHDADREMGQYPRNLALVAGLDPAGANEQAGYTAMILMGVDTTTGLYHLVDLFNHKQAKAPQVKDQMLAWAEQYPELREFRVESNGLQAQIFQYDQELNIALANKGVNLRPHITTGHNKWDPQFGVEAMAPAFHNQVVRIPWGGVWARRQFGQLQDQLVRFPKGKPDDLVMACWFAWLGCKDIYQRQSAPLFDPRRKVPARLRAKRHIVDFGRGIRQPTAAEHNGGWDGPAREVVTVNTDQTVRVY